MTNNDIYTLFREIGNVLVFLSLAIVSAQLWLYTRVNWRRTSAGRMMFTLLTVIAAILSLSVVRVFLGDTLWFAGLRLIVFAGLPIALGWMLWLQIQAQRRP